MSDNSSPQGGKCCTPENKETGGVEWPKVDVTEPFEAMEKRLGITKELDDVRRSSLGAHPSLSFYCNREPKMDIERMRAKFEKAARRY